MWFPGTIKRTTLLSVRGALNCVSLAQEFCFSVSARGVVGDFCVCFSCVSLDQSTSSSLPWCMCQFRCGWDRPTHIEIRKWKNLHEYCTSMIYIYVNIEIYITVYVFISWLYIYIMCVKVSWAVLSFSGCFLDDLFTVVSICTPRMAYFLKSENMFSIFRFVQAVCQLHS